MSPLISEAVESFEEAYKEFLEKNYEGRTSPLFRLMFVYSAIRLVKEEPAAEPFQSQILEFLHKEQALALGAVGANLN